MYRYLEPLRRHRWYPYLFAVALCVGATGIAWLIQIFLSTANLALLYITVVVLVAVYAGTRAALLCAFINFLALNFFFTEPRGSLVMIDTEDVITVVWFLIVAAIVGHLAASLQQKLGVLRSRHQFERVEMALLQELAQSLGDEDVLHAVKRALERRGGVSCHFLPVSAGEVDWRQVGVEIDPDVRQRVDALLRQSGAPGSIPMMKNAAGIMAPLSDGVELKGFILLPRKARLTPAVYEDMRLLIQQASLALARTRLSADLAREKLEKDQERLRSALLSSVSHDFRTPLTAMTGAASTLLEMGDELAPEQRRELLESIMDETGRLDDYTQNLLDMTRLGQGEMKLDRSWISIEEIVNAAVKRLRPHLDKQELKVDMEHGLPSLYVHPALIEQALFNVLHNASKFSPVNATIRLECRALDEGHVMVDVLDQGPGIEPCEREAVFDMFHTASRGDRRAAGSGLGLAICRGMVGAHGGTVEIGDGDGGRGCRVRITLPVEQPQSQTGMKRAG